MRRPPPRTAGRSGPRRDGRPGGGSARRPGPGGGRPGGGRPQRGGPGGGRFYQKKICRLCSESTDILNFRNVDLLKRYLTEKGKILPRRITGNCAKCQRVLARTIKRSRHAALIAFQIN